MSLSLAIALNVLADLALIAMLAYAMSRPSRLRPHLAGQPAQTPAAPTAQSRDRERVRTLSPLAAN
jgi:hypothetical protein